VNTGVWLQTASANQMPSAAPLAHWTAKALGAFRRATTGPFNANACQNRRRPKSKTRLLGRAWANVLER
jgi:hypothetical protein